MNCSFLNFMVLMNNCTPSSIVFTGIFDFLLTAIAPRLLILTFTQAVLPQSCGQQLSSARRCYILHNCCPTGSVHFATKRSAKQPHRRSTWHFLVGRHVRDSWRKHRLTANRCDWLQQLLLMNIFRHANEPKTALKHRSFVLSQASAHLG